jgi:poly(3-hydroxybutyrate) depolymerase
MLSLRTAWFSLSVLVPFSGACSSGSSPESGKAGSPSAAGGASSGSPGTGGFLATGGSGTGGAEAGGTMDHGGGAVTDGHAGSGGGTDMGEAAGSGGVAGGSVTGGGNAGGGAGGAGADSKPSTGCKNTPTLKNGTIDMMFSGASRKYILRVPNGYDNNHAYRLVLAYAWSGGSASQVVSGNYFTFATQDSKNTIFAAPDAANGAGSWAKADVEFTDAIIKQLEGDFCVDESRIFATGFSFGGGMAMGLACTRAEVFRGVAFFSGADLTGVCPATLTKPIAYYASQASEDSGGLSPTNPITGERKQAEFAALNGCTAEPSATSFPAAGQPHACTNYKGCSSGHPTEYCVFNGAHGWEPKDPGQAVSWDAPEAWKFITQF